MGIEPTSSAWKAEVLPLNYTRLPPSTDLVEGVGFEPTKAKASRFTVCPRWPLGYPSGSAAKARYYLLKSNSQSRSIRTATLTPVPPGRKPFHAIHLSCLNPM